MEIGPNGSAVSACRGIKKSFQKCRKRSGVQVIVLAGEVSLVEVETRRAGEGVGAFGGGLTR